MCNHDNLYPLVHTDSNYNRTVYAELCATCYERFPIEQPISYNEYAKIQRKKKELEDE